MKNPIIPKIVVFLLLLALSACSSFNYKTYDENQNKGIDDPDPNYDVTLDRNFQDFTGFMFIGNRIENFSTYFNTFFNASENFGSWWYDLNLNCLCCVFSDQVAFLGIVHQQTAMSYY